MVDAHALGACGLGRAGSTPASPTTNVLFSVRIILITNNITTCDTTS